MINIPLLMSSYNQREALELVLHTDPNLNIDDIEEVYYPYMRMRYHLTAGKIKKYKKYADCIIDRVNATTYVSRGEPEFEEIEVSEEDILEPTVDMDKCYELGHSFTLREFIAKAKMLSTPKIEILEENLFYKMFYIITCISRTGGTYYILLDSVDGGMTILDHEKHLQELAGQGELEEAEKVLSIVDQDEENEE